MPLLNYTTKVEAIKTVYEIQGILASHGAKTILINYANDSSIESLSFQVDTPHGMLGIRLPVDPDAAMKVLDKQKVPPRYKTKPQAIRIAWRILKDWVEAQMAILETEMVRMEQIFLPYIISSKTGQTVYELLEQRHFLIGEGDK